MMTAEFCFGSNSVQQILFRRTKAWLPWKSVCPSVGQSIKLSSYSHRSTCYFHFETDAYWSIVRCCCRKVVLKLNTYKNKRNEIVWQFTERMESKKEVDNRCCCPIVTKNASHPFKNPANSADIVGSKTSLKPGLSVVNVRAIISIGNLTSMLFWEYLLFRLD